MSKIKNEILVKMEAELRLILHKASGEVIDYGVVSRRCVTDAGVALLIDAMQAGAGDIGTMKYHGVGTGVTGELAADTAMEAEVETRGVGSQEEGATANIYKTIGTVDFTGSNTITEHGVLSAASDGTLLDRSVFSGIDVENLDSIEFTYQLTVTAGG